MVCKSLNDFACKLTSQWSCESREVLGCSSILWAGPQKETIHTLIRRPLSHQDYIHLHWEPTLKHMATFTFHPTSSLWWFGKHHYDNKCKPSFLPLLLYYLHFLTHARLHSQPCFRDPGPRDLVLCPLTKSLWSLLAPASWLQWLKTENTQQKENPYQQLSFPHSNQSMLPQQLCPDTRVGAADTQYDVWMQQELPQS